MLKFEFIEIILIASIVQKDISIEQFLLPSVRIWNET